MKELDCRGLSCPEPVVMTKKALMESPELDVLVDNRASLENVKRYASAMKKAVDAVQEGSSWRISIR